VISLEHAVAAPYASRMLADAGARVIKLERTEGDFARGYDACVNGMSSYFVWLNHGKESVFFNLKDADDVAFLHRLLARADVFLQNLGPDVTKRAGIGSAVLRERYPRLITCDISGYGDFGPYREMKGYDLLVQGESGLAFLSGTPDAPGRVGVSVCDIACGMSAFQLILQALYARTRTGLGRGVEASLYHSVADWMNVPYLQQRYGGLTPLRLGLHHPTIAPYGAYACIDGTSLLFAVQNEREWLPFCNIVLDDPPLGEDERFRTNVRRVEHREALDARINARLRELTRDEALARCREAGIAFGRISDVHDLVSHPQNRYAGVNTSHGDIEVLTRLDGDPHERRGSKVPDLGEHDPSVRAEFSETGK
jgi:crotonobetainyl-CoA:carnitine CoA-transferase CaiB-like acyl-CoA transferase